MTDLDHKQKHGAAESDQKRNGFVPRPAPSDALSLAGRPAAETSTRGTYSPALDDYLSPRLVELTAQIKAAPELSPKARKSAVRKSKRRPPSRGLPLKSPGAITSTAELVGKPETEPPSASPVHGDGQVGAEAEPPATNPPRQGDIEHDVKKFAARLRRQYAGQLADDQAARALKKKACSLLRRNLPPFAGHPKEDSITRAIELRKIGLEWKKIYPQVIPNHALLQPAIRRQAETNLRNAARSRRNARRRRKRQGESTAQTISPAIVSS